MRELHQPVDYAVSLYCDNQSAVSLRRTKHVEVHYHFIREKVLQDKVEMLYIKMNNQVADLFTKSLSIEKFQEFQQQLNMD